MTRARVENLSDEPSDEAPPHDDAPADAVDAADAPASPGDTTPPEDEPVVAAPAQDEMIDVMVLGPVLGAKMSSIIAVTPQVYADYRSFLRRIG